MPSVYIVLPLLAACALGLLWWWVRRAGRARVDGIDADRIDTLTGWPPQATRVLTLAERQAYSTLVRALPDFIVLAQVPLSRFLKVPRRHSYADWLQRLGHQCADFVVCDMHAQVLAVVELRATVEPAGERAQRRVHRMARTLKAAKLPLHIWAEGLLPSADAARQAIVPPPTPTTPFAVSPVSPVSPAKAVVSAENAPASTATIPTAALNPFEDTGRDSEHDERIELLEPPPSTWFDELDSGPVPLRKPSVKPAGPGRTRGH